MSFPFRGDTMNGIIRYLHIIDQIISLTLTPSSTWPGFQVSPIAQSNLHYNHLVSGNENNPSVRFSFTGIKPIVPSFSIVSHSTPGYAIHSFNVDGSDALDNLAFLNFKYTNPPRPFTNHRFTMTARTTNDALIRVTQIEFFGLLSKIHCLKSLFWNCSRCLYDLGLLRFEAS